MNISNNLRYKSTEEKIEDAFLRLLKRKKYNSIYVQDLCKEAGINRSSFYAHYLDINDLMMKYEDKVAQNVVSLFKDSQFEQENFLQLFKFVKDNATFYKAYLQSNLPSFMDRGFIKIFKNYLSKMSVEKEYYYTNEELEYHMAFFGAGLRAICAKWLNDNCKLSPEEVSDILIKEYKNNAKCFIKSNT